jgi:preprotein translocase subunit SecD
MKIRSAALLGLSFFVFAGMARAQDQAPFLELPFEMRLIVPEGTAGAIRKTLPTKPGGDPQMLWCAKEVVMDASDVKSAVAQEDPRMGWAILLEFNEAGAKKFAKVTTDHIQQRLGILVAGKLLTAPTLMSPILGGRAQISGVFTGDEAKKLAETIQNGTTSAKH